MRGGFLVVTVAFVFVLAGCHQSSNVERGSLPNLPSEGKGVIVNDSGKDFGMSEEERAVLEAYEAMQQAMIDKDVDAMRALTTEDKTFTHMSGKVQTREEFFGEIADGTLNYFGYQIHDPHVTVEGDGAMLTGATTLDARVYGASGSWMLPMNARFVKQDGRWIQCN